MAGFLLPQGFSHGRCKTKLLGNDSPAATTPPHFVSPPARPLFRSIELLKRPGTRPVHVREADYTGPSTAKGVSSLEMKPLTALILVFFLFAANTKSQNDATAPQPSGAGNTFRLNPAFPFVYLKFDHIGAGKKEFSNEPTTRIWLRLVNNCHLPIVVRGGDRLDSGVAGEVFFEEIAVVPNSPIFTISSGPPSEPEAPTLGTTLAEPSTKKTRKPAHTSVPRAKPPIAYRSASIVARETRKTIRELLGHPK